MRPSLCVLEPLLCHRAAAVGWLQSAVLRHLCCKTYTAYTPGFSIVFCAAARWKGALVAVKVIEHGRTDSSSAVDIARESSLATSVVHPNVVSVMWPC